MSDIIHRKKLFDGEAVEKVAFDVLFKGKSCDGCGSPKPIIRIQTFIAIKDIPHGKVREGVKLLVASGVYQKVPLKDGIGIRSGVIFACAACQRDAEVSAARGPSFAVVVIDRMPTPDTPLIQVTR